MERRDLLKGLLALPIVGLLPFLKKPEPEIFHIEPEDSPLRLLTASPNNNWGEHYVAELRKHVTTYKTPYGDINIMGPRYVARS